VGEVACNSYPLEEKIEDFGDTFSFTGHCHSHKPTICIPLFRQRNVVSHSLRKSIQSSLIYAAITEYQRLIYILINNSYEHYIFISNWYLFLVVLEAGSPRSLCWHLVRVLLLPYPMTDNKRVRESLWKREIEGWVQPFMEATHFHNEPNPVVMSLISSFMKIEPHILNHLLKVTHLKTVTLEIKFLTHGFGAMYSNHSTQ
jgi:hypothetical protein